MAGRGQAKPWRRPERRAAERAAAAQAARRRIAGAALGAVVAGAGIVVASGLAGGGAGQWAALAASARAAGCRLTSYPSQGRRHTTVRVAYNSNPPTSGPHNPVPAHDGIYAPGREPPPSKAVHALEHGRVEFEYRPGSRPADVAKLRAMVAPQFNGLAGYHALLFESDTHMPSQFAVAAWTKLLTCSRLTPRSEGVMAQFRRDFTDKGPESVP